MTDLAALREWLDRYERAWRSNDAADIAGLFSADAIYRWRPWDTAEHGAASGRDAIVEAWLAEPDDPSGWSLECEALAVNGYQPPKPVYFSNKTGYSFVAGATNKTTATFANADNTGPCQACHTRTSSSTAAPRFQTSGGDDGRDDGIQNDLRMSSTN